MAFSTISSLASTLSSTADTSPTYL
jgi:hypothetical protein